MLGVSSLFRVILFIPVSTALDKYLEQNVRPSLATYASAIEPSGYLLFRTKYFKSPKYLSM
ncbi:hypothetical protein MtrunA17_Chr4g0012981 [Medicago truncatula]|uniref:Transmembrane protein n=1 Tax=Medicago truncatula TaxID=3880 RepID=A0A396I1B5_MEDTR|nr:hypothetical protein MtrunA17_Chr4g0012981 [Medicago truncatula]